MNRTEIEFEGSIQSNVFCFMLTVESAHSDKEIQVSEELAIEFADQYSAVRKLVCSGCQFCMLSGYCDTRQLLLQVLRYVF